jgi:hypothetical protein
VACGAIGHMADASGTPRAYCDPRPREVAFWEGSQWDTDVQQAARRGGSAAAASAYGSAQSAGGLASTRWLDWLAPGRAPEGGRNLPRENASNLRQTCPREALAEMRVAGCFPAWPRAVRNLCVDLPAEHHGAVLVGLVVTMPDVFAGKGPELATDEHRLAGVQRHHVLLAGVVGVRRVRRRDSVRGPSSSSPIPGPSAPAPPRRARSSATNGGG